VPRRACAKIHPYQRLIDRMRRILLDMGFTEIKGDIVQSSFWNFDALFQPQDHPAREMQDTFYLDSEADLPAYYGKVRDVHEFGGDTGSTGWGGRWSAELSRKAAGDDHWVLGSIGPSGTILMMGEVSEDELYEDFLIQVQGLADGGVDAFCIETFSALDEAECAIKAAKTTNLPIICTFTFENGFSMMGVTPEAYAEKMLELGVDVLGTNCGNGLSGMVDYVKAIRNVAPDHPILIHANAGLPIIRGTETVYPETPDHMALQVPEIINAGAKIIGGCCGTGPKHIEKMCKKVRG